MLHVLEYVERAAVDFDAREYTLEDQGKLPAIDVDE